MAPKGQSFETSLRETNKVVKVSDKKKADVDPKERKRSNSKSQPKKVAAKKTNIKPKEAEVENTEEVKEMTAEDDNSVRKYVAVSPRIFRKNIFHSNKLQKEIVPGKKGSFQAIEFDPAKQCKAPIYLDIPNLYTRRRYSQPGPKTGEKGRERYKYVPEQGEGILEDARPRYIYIARPVTPKNYNPRPKSSNRYVFVGVKPRYKGVSVSGEIKTFYRSELRVGGCWVV